MVIAVLFKIMKVWKIRSFFQATTCLGKDTNSVTTEEEQTETEKLADEEGAVHGVYTGCHLVVTTVMPRTPR